MKAVQRFAYVYAVIIRRNINIQTEITIYILVHVEIL